MNMISVIVPIYKVEKYINRCIESLLNQTFSDFELILVDDGSPDHCGEICDDYGEKDNRVKVIHKENGGLSDARNAGFKAAKGEYVVFVDSDDWVAPAFLESLYIAIQGNDICECEIVRTSTDSITYLESNGETVLYSAQDALQMLILDRGFHQYVWNKMYKKSLIDDIHFEVGKTNEDEFWTYQVFGRAERIVKISNVLYCYYQRDDSIMGKQYNINRLDGLEAKFKRQKYLEKKYPALVPTGKISLYYSCLYAGQMTLKHLSLEDKEYMKKQLEVYWHSINLKKHDIKEFSLTEKFWYYILKCNFWGGCYLRNLLNKGM